MSWLISWKYLGYYRNALIENSRLSTDELPIRMVHFFIFIRNNQSSWNFQNSSCYIIKKQLITFFGKKFWSFINENFYIEVLISAKFWQVRNPLEILKFITFFQALSVNHVITSGRENSDQKIFTKKFYQVRSKSVSSGFKAQPESQHPTTLTFKFVKISWTFFENLTLAFMYVLN